MADIEGYMLTVRRTLDAFCAEHDLDIDSATAVAAATHLMGLVSTGESSPHALRARLREWLLEQTELCNQI